MVTAGALEQKRGSGRLWKALGGLSGPCGESAWFEGLNFSTPFGFCGGERPGAGESANDGSMKNFLLLIGAIFVLVLAAGAGLYFVAAGLEPPQTEIESVIPDDTFPR